MCVNILEIYNNVNIAFRRPSGEADKVRAGTYIHISPFPLYKTYFMCFSDCLHVCLFTTYVSGTRGGQKRTSDPLRLDFNSWL